MMGRKVEIISEKHSDNPCWLREANNGDIRRKSSIGIEEVGQDGRNLSSS